MVKEDAIQMGAKDELAVLRGWRVWLIPALLLFMLLVPLARVGLPATKVGLLLSLDAEATKRVLGASASTLEFNLWVLPLGYKWSVVLFCGLLTAAVGLLAQQLWGRVVAWWVASLWVLLPLTLTLVYQIGWFSYFNALTALLFGLFFGLMAAQSSRWYWLVALYLLFVGLTGLSSWQSGLDPYQLLLPLWPEPDNLRLWLEHDTYQVGLVPLLLAIFAGMVAWPRRQELAAKKVLFLLALGLLCLLLALFDGPILLYLTIATLAFIFAAGGLPILDARYASFPVLLALLTIAALTVYPYLQVAWLSPSEYKLSAFTSEWHFGENTFWVVDWQVERTETSNKLTILWQSTANPPQNYSAFVHFLNEEGDIIAQADALLTDQDAIPTSQWPIGYLVTQTYSADSPTAASHVRFGLYQLETGERLLVNGADHVVEPVR